MSKRNRHDSKAALRADYVIVGAGAAGCLLADRLSACGRYQVVLVEAGGADTHPLIHVPAGVGALIGHPDLDWGYATVPQPGAAGRSIPLPRGRVLGGCTSTNGMVFFRGHPHDYDEWVRLGCEGWSYEDVLPYFEEIEDNASFAGPGHGRGGPVHVSSYGRANPLSHRFVTAAQALGHRHVEDFNLGDPAGFGLRQASIRNGRRVSAATAFLRTARNRPNFRILTRRLADKLIFDGSRTTGIELQHQGRAEQVYASAEVILCGGSFGSPAILERSGFGDPAILTRLGIPIRQDLPQVGQNLQDHVVAPVQMRTSSALPYVVDIGVLPRLVRDLGLYLMARGGPLASNVFEATGFVRTNHAEGHADARADVQLIFMPMNRAPGPLPRKRGYGILVGLLRPHSRGTVHIASATPQSAPTIDPQFLSAPDDLPPLIDGIRLARKLLGSAPFSNLGSQEMQPGPDAQSDDELELAIRKTCVTVHHPAGTCRMGSDPASVVDPELRVRGVAGLRVVDASIMPRLIGGNTAAPVYMIAQKAADMILTAAKATS